MGSHKAYSAGNKPFISVRNEQNVTQPAGNESRYQKLICTEVILKNSRNVKANNKDKQKRLGIFSSF